MERFSAGWLEAWLGVELNAVIAWDYTTPHKIAHYLAREVGAAGAAAEDEIVAEGSTADEDFERLLAEIENLSDDEAEYALSQEPPPADV